MKVFHINSNYLATTLHQTMIEHMEQAGVQNLVFAPIYPGFRRVIEPIDAVCVSVCYQKWNRYLFSLKKKRILRAAGEAMRGHEFDCIHAYTLFTDGACARALAKEAGIPYVVALRNTDVNHFLRLRPNMRPLGVRILRDAAKVLFLSESYQEKVLSKYVPAACRKELEEKSMVVPNGIDDFWLNNRYSDKSLPQSLGRKLRLIFAGRIVENKNLRGIVSAIDLLRKQDYDAVLTVVGPHADERLCRDLDAIDFVQLLDPMAKEELIGEYRKSDIFVMPSFRESFGLVYAEAMSQGLPVVYSAGEGFDGQFPDGEIGFAVDPNTPEQIADRIRRIAENYGAIANRCLMNADRFRWDTIVQTYLRMYEAIL